MAYYGFIARRTSHLFVQNHAMLEWMHAKEIPGKHMTAVPMGVVDAETLEHNPVLVADEIS